MNAVYDAITEIPGHPDFKVLDLSCGDGELLEKLDRLGCSVEGTHFKTGDYVFEDPRPILEVAPIHGEVNLHEKLPFDDDSFDLVLLTEVLEHLDSHANIVSEVGGILKAGGSFIFTTPNIYRLHSRLKFFLTGTHKLIRRRAGWDTPVDENYSYHQTPVDFPMMHVRLHQAGMAVVKLALTKFKLRHGYLLLLYPLIWVSCKLSREGTDKEPLYRAGENDLMKWMAHPYMLASEQLMVICQKRKP